MTESSLVGTAPSILRLVNIVLRYRRLLGLSWLAGVLLFVVAPALFGTKQFVSESKFLPHIQESPASALAGLAAQLGFAGGTRAGEGPDFYVALLQSRELLRELIRSRYRLAADAASRASAEGDLIQAFGLQKEPMAARVPLAMSQLRKNMLARADGRTGVVTLRVAAPSASLAEQINARALVLVNEFNLRKRQSQAAAERRFVDARMREAQQELNRAEGVLESFLEQNRRYTDSPQLTFEAARLQRRVDLRQQLYTSLAQAYEAARIAEVRNTPVITVVDRPDGSAARTGRSLLFRAVVGTLVGLLLGLVAIFASEHVRRQAGEHPEDFKELSRLSRAVMVELRAQQVLAFLRDKLVKTSYASVGGKG